MNVTVVVVAQRAFSLVSSVPVRNIFRTIALNAATKFGTIA
jgi:hypothetical protein